MLRTLRNMFARHHARRAERLRQERAELVSHVFARKPGHQVALHRLQALTVEQLKLEARR